MSTALPAPREHDCAHCGLKVPAGRRSASLQEFCCDGCEAVHAALAANGLLRWYELRERTGGDTRQPARTTGRSHAELDDPAFHGLHVTSMDGKPAVDLYLEGVHCAACVWLVERLPQVLPGVVSSRLDVASGRARIAWEPATTQLSVIARTLDSLGYTPHPWRGSDHAAAREREDRILLLRLGVAGAGAANAMMLAAAMYVDAWGDMSQEHVLLLRTASLLVSVPVALWAALPFHRSAWASLRAGVLHVDLPLSMAILAAFGVSVVDFVRGHGDIYFDSACALVFLLLVARWLARRATRRADGAERLLAALAPSSARLVEAGAVREVAVESLVAGQIVEVRAGETLPVDGEILEGRSHADVALLTGESRHEPIGVGDRVHAGTVNLSARLLVRANEVGERTRLGRLAALMTEAAARRPRVFSLVDRLSGMYVVAVLALAGVTLAAWWSSGPALALQHALALLVVTCPCVLAFATPLALNVALGKAARRGLLVKGGDVVEHLARPGVIVLDKTGTLTEGRLHVAAWEGAEWARPLLLSLERQSAHPLAKAFAEDLAGEPELEAECVEQVQGAGIRGRVNGRDVRAGTPCFVGKDALGAAWAERICRRLGALALSPVLVSVDGEVVAVAGLGDRVRSEAAAVVGDLRARGWRVVLLSGDDARVARAVAREVGIAETDARGGMSPERKLAFVRELMESSKPVVMVGDGVNDAAALAAAHVGVALHGGAEASLAAADVFTTRPGLAGIVELVEGAKRVGSLLHANAAISIAYNVAGATLAMSGVLSPLVAALLMPASSLTVTAVSLRWPTFRKARVQPCQ